MHKATIAILSSLWRGVVVGFAGLATLFAAIAAVFSITDGAQYTLVVGFGLYIFLILTAVCVHEFGHALGAQLAGWKVHLIAVGPMEYRPGARKFKRRTRNRREPRGLVFATPHEGCDWTKGKWILILFGPLANLLCAAIVFWIASLTGSRIASSLLGCFAVISLVIGVANLIPFCGPGRTASDGARLLSILLGRTDDDTPPPILRLAAVSLDGRRPAQWDQCLIREVELCCKNASFAELGDPMLLSYYLSRHELEHCRRITDRHSKTAKVPSLDVMIEHAFLIALMDRDSKRAFDILHEIPSRISCRSFPYWRALAVAHSVSGNVRDAGIAIETALGIARRTKANPDQDDRALFSAIAENRALPDWRTEPVLA